LTDQIPRIAAALGLLALAAQAAGPPAVFTQAQAEAGKTAYESSCIACHTESLIAPEGALYQGQQIAPLAGPAFLAKWSPRTTNALSSRIREAVGGFPPKGANESTHLELAAYILQVSGARAGAQALTDDTAAVTRTTLAGPQAKLDLR
jgi:cytochrome c5